MVGATKRRTAAARGRRPPVKRISPGFGVSYVSGETIWSAANGPAGLDLKPQRADGAIPPGRSLLLPAEAGLDLLVPSKYGLLPRSRQGEPPFLMYVSILDMAHKPMPPVTEVAAARYAKPARRAGSTLT